MNLVGLAISMLNIAPRPSGHPDLFGMSLAYIGTSHRCAVSKMAIGDPFGESGLGRIWVVDTQSHQLLYVIAGFPGEASLGIQICGDADVDGDGQRDIVSVGLDDGRAGAGIMRVFSGIDGDPIGILPYPCSLPKTEWSKWATRPQVCSVGDITGDCCDDLAIATQYGNGLDKGYVMVLSGADCSTIWRVDGAVGDRLGASIDRCADVNQDGVRDLVVAARSKLLVLSGSSGVVLHEGAYYAAAPEGPSVVSVTDADADGLRDVMVVSALPEARTMALVTYASTTLRTIHTQKWTGGATRSNVFAQTVGDCDGDLIDDLFASTPVPLLDEAESSAWIISGKSTIMIYEVSGDQLHDAMFGVSACRLGDRNMDGIEDFAVGAASERTAGVSGSVTTYCGRSGKAIARITRSALLKPLGRR